MAIFNSYVSSPEGIWCSLGDGLAMNYGRLKNERLKTILREWETSVGHGHICLFYGCIEGHVKITDGMFTSTGISETYKISVVVISLSSNQIDAFNSDKCRRKGLPSKSSGLVY